MPLILTVEQRAEIARRITTEGLLDAIAYARALTGAGLAEANEAVRAIAAELIGPPPSPGEMSAEVFAVGRFRRELANALDYSALRHRDMREGALVLTSIFTTYHDSDETRALAACFGIDPWDFNEHALDASRADVEALRALDNESAERFMRLRDAGFAFYFYGPEPDEG